MTRTWNIVNDSSKSTWDAINKFKYSRDILKSDLCDYSDVEILVSGDIITVAAPAA